MKNKLGVVLLTTVITLLCLYYLSLSLITRRIEERATTAATDSLGQINTLARQQYLDSIWNEPVVDALGLSFSYKELKETELNLGLDLQGGMHVTLEVSPSGVIRALARNPKDSALNAALAAAKGADEDFINAFYKAYQQAKPNSKLTDLFAHLSTQGKIDPTDTDAAVLDVLRSEAEDVITRSFYILRARIDRFGTSQPNIQRLQNSARIQIELPGVDNPARVRNLLRGVAELNFYEVANPNDISPVFSSINQWYLSTLQDSASQELDDLLDEPDDLADLLAEEPAFEDLSTDADSLSSNDTTLNSLTDTAAINSSAEDTTLLDSTLNESALDSLLADSATTAQDSSVQDDPLTKSAPLFSLLRASDRLLYEVKDTTQINRFLKQEAVQERIPASFQLLWSVQPITQDNTSYLELHILENPTGTPSLSGNVITNASQTFDQFGRPAISMQMNSLGAKKWRLLTRNNIGEQIAIVLDNRVYSAPVVESEIANGTSQITGDFSIEESKDLANILKSGALPAPIEIVEDVVIGPTLGKLAQKQGVISILSGFCIVILFMVMYYARGGIIANVALAFNIFFILGVLTQLNASLTLAGIAGIVLTIGMSIDANVLIFERIREELRSGTGIKQAVQLGYKRAYSSIIDANVTTFITGGILYVLGQGPIKGFAITLMVGIVCAFFTAVFITRLVITWILERKDSGNVTFSTIFSKKLSIQPKINWMKYKGRAYVFSLIIIGLGLVAIIVKGGLNLGVDFLGGRSYVVQFSEAPAPYELKAGLSEYLGNKSVEVKNYGNPQTLKITTNYLVNDNSGVADSLVQTQLIAGIAQLTQLSQIQQQPSTPIKSGFYIASTVKVGATIADDIKDSSSNAIILSLIAIFLYILVRFRYWQFGVGALIALFHDVLIVLSTIAIVYALGISLEIDQVFIAAILTLIGYSINDTVVIFDRIREQLGLKRSGNRVERFNDALNQTLSRTLITSSTTLFVVVILLVFGGEVLRSFSFTLLIGIITGTYSSLLIATPAALDLMRQDTAPSKRKRLE